MTTRGKFNFDAYSSMSKLINHDRVLYADKYVLSRIEEDEKQNKLEEWLAAALRFNPNIDVSGETEFLFFRSLQRPDYADLFARVASCVSRKTFVQDYQRYGQRINPEMSRLMVTLRPFYYSFSAESSIDRSLLFTRLCQYYMVLKKVCEIDTKALVFFADMQPVEDLIAQYGNACGIQTITLQHGLYVDYGSFNTVNVINYLHQPSKMFLAWGDETARLIRKYHPETDVRVCGKPVIYDSPNRGEDSRSGYFTVVLDQRIFDDQNVQLLRLLEEYARSESKSMNIRFHPSNDRRYYRSLGVEFTEDLPLASSDFVVGHTSSLIYETLQMGIPSFRYVTEIPAVAFPSQLAFTTIEEFRQALNSKVDYSAESKRYVACSGEESMRRYEVVFNEVSESVRESITPWPEFHELLLLPDTANLRG